MSGGHKAMGHTIPEHMSWASWPWTWCQVGTRPWEPVITEESHSPAGPRCNRICPSQWTILQVGADFDLSLAPQQSKQVGDAPSSACQPWEQAPWGGLEPRPSPLHPQGQSHPGPATHQLPQLWGWAQPSSTISHSVSLSPQTLPCNHMSLGNTHNCRTPKPQFIIPFSRFCCP